MPNDITQFAIEALNRLGGKRVKEIVQATGARNVSEMDEAQRAQFVKAVNDAE